MPRLRPAASLLLAPLLSCSRGAPDAARVGTAEPPASVEITMERPAPAPVSAETPPAPPTASARTAKPAAAQRPAADEDATAPCLRSDRAYGQGTPTADEMLAVVRAFPADCGPAPWQVPALRACMDKLGDPNVVVMYGQMDASDHQPIACQLGVVGVAWNGRRFVVLQNSYREHATFFGYNHVYELKGRAPVLFMDGRQKHSPLCQSGGPGAAEPPGWKAFPAELQALFCH